MITLQWRAIVMVTITLLFIGPRASISYADDILPEQKALIKKMSKRLDFEEISKCINAGVFFEYITKDGKVIIDNDDAKQTAIMSAEVLTNLYSLVAAEKLGQKKTLKSYLESSGYQRKFKKDLVLFQPLGVVKFYNTVFEPCYAAAVFKVVVTFFLRGFRHFRPDLFRVEPNASRQ